MDFPASTAPVFTSMLIRDKGSIRIGKPPYSILGEMKYALFSYPDGTLVADQHARKDRCRLKYAFDAAGIEIPFPHLTLYAGQLRDGSSPPFNLSRDTGTQLSRDSDEEPGGAR